MRSAGVPQGIAFAAKPALAREMIGRALDAGTPAAWAAGDEVYGQDPQLRAELARRGLGYVLAVAKSHPVTTPAGVGGRIARRPLADGEQVKDVPPRRRKHSWTRTGHRTRHDC